MPKKLDDFQKAIKKSLKKQYPKMKSSEVDSKSFAMAQTAYKKWKASGGKEVVSKRRIVAENVPIIFGAEVGLVQE